MKLRVLSPAFEEMFQAASWLDAQRVGLGDRFRQTVDAVLARIEENPHQFAKSEFADEEMDFRIALVRQFNYAIHFLIEADEAQVVCIAHAARRPGYWLSRVKNA